MDYVNRKSEFAEHPLGSLPPEDLNLVLELVLQSGSLKDLAASYGVTYPTIRLRLDRVIQRLRAEVDGRSPDPLSELLAKMIETGELTAVRARAIRDLARDLAQAQVEKESSFKGGRS